MRIGRYGAALCVIAFATQASAAPRWVDRRITLPRLVFAGDIGLGAATRDAVDSLICVGGSPCTFNPEIGRGPITGVGANVEGAFGITDSFEIGLRSGLRFGSDGKLVPADAFGRTLWTETYGTARDTFANPEVRLRLAIPSGRVAEVGLDARLYVPIEAGASVGVMVGLPLAFHVADFMRIDTGAYVPAVFSKQTATGLSVPVYLWFQASDRIWLGPMTSVRHVDTGSTHLEWLIGLGLGAQLSASIDIKAMVFVPRANEERAFRRFGGGIGAQFRFGE